MGNTLEAFNKTHNDEDDEVHQPMEEDNEEVVVDPAEYQKYIKNEELLDNSPNALGRLPVQSRDLRRYESSILAPLAPSAASIHEKPKCQILLKILTPILFVLKPFWWIIVYINDCAGSPVGEDANLQNGCIFVSSVGVLIHGLQLLFCQCKRTNILRKMYDYYNYDSGKVFYEYIMMFCNMGNMISAYSNTWQSCIPYILLTPLYMVYMIYSIVKRHLDPASLHYYHTYLSIEQGFRVLWLMFEFSVLMGYARKLRSERAARDGFIKARRNRLKLLDRTRRQEDRREFLRDPIRQKTVLLLADPRKPWMKQTMAAKLAENAFAENTAVASLYAPSSVARPIWDEETNQVILAKERPRHHQKRPKQPPPVPHPSEEQLDKEEDKKGGFFSFFWGKSK